MARHFLSVGKYVGENSDVWSLCTVKLEMSLISISISSRCSVCLLARLLTMMKTVCTAAAVVGCGVTQISPCPPRESERVALPTGNTGVFSTLPFVPRSPLASVVPPFTSWLCRYTCTYRRHYAYIHRLCSCWVFFRQSVLHLFPTIDWPMAIF